MTDAGNLVASSLAWLGNLSEDVLGRKEILKSRIYPLMAELFSPHCLQEMSKSGSVCELTALEIVENAAFFLSELVETMNSAEMD